MLLAKAKLNSIKVLICKALIDSYMNHGEFLSVNNVLQEYNEVESWKYCGIYCVKIIETYCVSCKKNPANKKSSVRKLNKTD